MQSEGSGVAPEPALVEAAATGDRQAFDELARRYRPQMLSRARSIVGPSDAEDVVQIALVSAFRALERGTPPDSFVAWLSTITRNTAISHLRGGVATAPLRDELLVRPIDEAVIERDEVRRLTTAINELPATERAALIGRELEGRGHQEIAAMEGISPGAARQAIHRARTRVRAALAAALIPFPALLSPARWLARIRSIGATGGAAAGTAALAATVAIAAGVGGGGSDGRGSGAAAASDPAGAAASAAFVPGSGDGGPSSGAAAASSDGKHATAPGASRAAGVVPASGFTAAPAPAPATAIAAVPPPAPEPESSPQSAPGTYPQPPAPPPGVEDAEPVPPPADPPPIDPPLVPPPTPPAAVEACVGLVPCVLDLVETVVNGGG